MANDLPKNHKLVHSKVNISDSTTIQLGEDFEIRYWEEKLGVPEEEIRKAISKVGPMVGAVRDELCKNHAPKGDAFARLTTRIIRRTNPD